MKKDKIKELEKLPFEQALQKLEQIVEEMEEGNLPLDKMINCFEEGVALSRVCGGKLKELEKKIQILVKDNSSEGDWKDFDPENSRVSTLSEIEVEDDPDGENPASSNEDLLF